MESREKEPPTNPAASEEFVPKCLMTEFVEGGPSSFIADHNGIAIYLVEDCSVTLVGSSFYRSSSCSRQWEIPPLDDRGEV